MSGIYKGGDGQWTLLERIDPWALGGLLQGSWGTWFHVSSLAAGDGHALSRCFRI
ncbi:uncharacterized protein B0I36DRAFT_318644 [Microdochium trichocladiopsis]|uniref:Uncharacterized protein n=1 Tax=Microdochium trichocladiopsis TaxID=1682393 RepID=A0A9P9BTK4_9PEZI|nr:uncharacterized protein B0I36DRAFT_318644 [Microdochium trichocladiopsis]KAH7035582.1 hypothetical protein B0I36DRAFT_318644 [Microdochium trichocladiopsis]